MRLSEKVIVVTGGAGLIGQLFCQDLLSNGARVVIAEKNTASAQNFVDTIDPEDRARCSIVELDITQTESVVSAIEKIDSLYGRIDGLVNNAYPRNSRYGRQFFDVEYDAFCENISMNIGGYFLCSQKFADYFINQGYGNIVNIASIYGVVAPRFEIYEGLNMSMPIEYSAIKSALVHMSKYMAKLFAGKNIRVNCLSPGGIYDQHDPKFCEAYKKHCLSKGMLDASDLSGSLLFLLSDESKYVNGQNIVVDDGFTL